MTLWVRFEHEGAEGFGTLDQSAGKLRVHAGDMFDEAAATAQEHRLEDIRLLAPVRPRLFIGLWNNFHELAVKLGAAIPETPLYFLKSPSSIVGPGEAISKPPGYTGKTVYEGELGIVIGRICRGATEEAAAGAIFGYTCVNDVTALDILHSDPAFAQWARAKSCDSFGPCGPAVATGVEWSELRVRTSLNGRERQNYAASDMILPPARIVSLISQELTLAPGDLIACGTSIGVLPMRPGMTVEVAIEGIGTLRNVFAG